MKTINLNRRRIGTYLIFGLVISLFICQFRAPTSYEEQLVRVQTNQLLGHIDERITDEPVEIQAMLLDYSDNSALVMKAWLAIGKYNEKAREIISLYGSEPEFKEILLNYGESIIPPIQYFMENEVWSLKAMSTASKQLQTVTETAKGTWNRMMGGKEQKNTSTTTEAQPTEFGPKERGWYAVNFIKQEGYDFIGQFVVTSDMKVKWVQTDRIAKGITSFFFSGLRTLETKYDLGEEITKGDMFWAGVDAAVMVSAVKLLRGAKALARSGKELSIMKRTKAFSTRLISKSKILWKIGKYSAVPVGVYIIIAHPSLVTSLFTNLARLIHLPAWLVQIIGWTIIISGMMIIITLLIKPLVNILQFLINRFRAQQVH